jgi:hypothetical protein
MAQPPDLDTVIETIITDSYGDDEQYTAFLTVIEEQTRYRPRRQFSARR